jgi:hypothetical protein
LCGEAAVYAEWTLDRNGAIAQSEQCTVCGERYDPNQLPTRAAVLMLAEWRPAPDLEEVTDDAAHVPAGSPESESLHHHDQTVA